MQQNKSITVLRTRNQISMSGWPARKDDTYCLLAKCSCGDGRCSRKTPAGKTGKWVICALYQANTHQLEGMKPDERQALEALWQERDMDWEDAGDISFGDILNGTEQLEVSNAGGELMDLAQGLMGDLCKEWVHVSRSSSVSLTYVSIVIVIEVHGGRTTARDVIVSFVATKHSGNNYPRCYDRFSSLRSEERRVGKECA